ncbi:MAG: co-chaperone GroES [Planctomycetes bacterium]|nr:co-chaperone GroES [Planctomycetota bacterium]
MKIRPLSDKIVVKPLEGETKTKGGIVLPDNAKEKPQKGEVIAVGEGRVLKNGSLAKPVVKKGDMVIYGKYSGNEMKLDETTYVIMKEDEVLAKIE